MNALRINSNLGNSSWSGYSHRSLLHRAFSMVELLVVIAIIAVLAGLLLVALSGAKTRAQVTKTRTTLQSFGKACDAFQLEHGRYPGIIPETILAANPLISGTENAILDLMGGAVRGDDPNYDSFNGTEIIIDAAAPFGIGKIKVNTQLIGNGPVINGTLHSPYFTPKGDELQVTSGQVGPPGAQSLAIPDLIDAWGQPIVFVKRSRPIGPLALDSADTSIKPQFLYGTMTPYIESNGIGEFGRDQTDSNKGSIFNNAGSPPADRYATFAQILRHAAFGEPDDPLRGNSQGAYMLFSAGPDGIYFSIADGPGTPGNTVKNIVDDPDFGNPLVIKEYDDIRIFGGG